MSDAPITFEVHNPHKGMRTFWDERGRQTNIGAGQTKVVRMRPSIIRSANLRSQLTFIPMSGLPADGVNHSVLPAIERALGKKPAFVVTGMFGIGDNIHQRGPLKVLMEDYEVHLETPMFWCFHDLVARGLKLYMRDTKLHAQRRQLEKERGLGVFQQGSPPKDNVSHRRIAYNRHEIEQFGSIAASMYGTTGLPKPDRIDFTMPVRADWQRAARDLMATWDMGNKPLMVLRQVIARREWDGRARMPDIAAFRTLYQSIRDKSFVVSVADLIPEKEWIEGGELDVDVKLHHAEIDLETMSALVAEAALVFSPAGFMPVMAQAVGTPVVAIYGRRESYKTTEAAGAHLAPTLGIDPITSCDCHSDAHRCQGCDNRIDVAAALPRLAEFTTAHAKGRPRVLIFATTYEDCQDRAELTDLWVKVHGTLNPDCDLLMVDSASPHKPIIAERHPDFVRTMPGRRQRRSMWWFNDNVGHLSRNGKDGWGRAFCKGLDLAVSAGYDYAVHIEGDSLFRLPVMQTCEQMRREAIFVASTPVNSEKQTLGRWVETGLMFFDCEWLRASNFTRQYDWPSRKKHPTPEVIVRGLVNDSLKVMPWRAWRQDKVRTIDNQNINDLNLDWVTHCHEDKWCYVKFAEAALGNMKEVVTGESPSYEAKPAARVMEAPAAGLKLNLGCGDNKLRGWENRDADVDITKPLPWTDGSAKIIFAEHVVEHVTFHQALDFFAECRRVLAPGGIVRIAVPALDRVVDCDDFDYFRFTTKWQDIGPTAQGAGHAIARAHGHLMAWSESTLRAALIVAGFNAVTPRRPGVSDVAELRGAEGHHRVIGVKFNDIETVVCEGTRP